jgi:hypothetical protein
VQFFQVGWSEFSQALLPEGGQADTDDAVVASIGQALDQARRGGPIHEPHCAVVPLEQVTGKVAHGRRLAARMSLDGDQELMLDMREASRAGLVLAPALELAQARPEGQQVLEVLAC